jgi:aspartyl aminopeptidase
MFNNHSDTGGGGTIGPILSANYGVCSVDIGNPTIAMHAVREFGGTADGYYMAKLFEAFFMGK